MIRNLMASSALAALAAAGAFTAALAQTEEQPATVEQPALTQDPVLGAEPAATATEPVEVEEPAVVVSDQPTLTPNEPTIATAFIGRSVYSSQDSASDNIGEVSDLIIGQDGKITHAVVGVGGFLGIGQKDVAVPFQELQVVQQDGDLRLIYAATREQLEAAEAYDRAAYDPQERQDAQEEQQAAADATTSGTAADAPVGDMTAAPAATDTTQPETVVVAAPEQPAQDLATVPADAQPVAAPPPTETEQQMEAGNASPQSGTGAFMSYSPDQVRASTLIGQELYGTEDEAIGEVSDLVLQNDGKTRAALIDVGGFLGIGEKRVAIPFDQIQMQTQPADGTTVDPAAPAASVDPAAPADTAAPADPAAPADSAAPAATTDPAAQPVVTAADTAAQIPRLTVSMSREQLEQLPAYEDPQDQAAEAAAQQSAAVDATAPAADGVAVTTDPNAPAATGEAMTTNVDPNAPADQSAATADVQDQFQPVTTEVGTDDLMGAAVLSNNDENLGDVGDLIFDQQGAIQAVIVDVGGFLGMGAKSVAIPYGSLQIMQNSAGALRLMLDATKEQLEAAPEYNEMAAADPNATTQPAQ